MTKKKWKSAEELMSELANDPNYIEIRNTRNEKFQQLEAKYAELSRPVLDLLRTKGFDAESIEDLVKSYAPLSSDIVSIILDFIEPCQDARHNERLVRALAASKMSFDGGRRLRKRQQLSQRRGADTSVA